jgi:hypothetical protein
VLGTSIAVGCQPAAGCAHAFWTVGASCRRSALNMVAAGAFGGRLGAPPMADTAAATCARASIDMSVVILILPQIAGTRIPGSRESLEVKP